jgi:hypothetical protein
MTPMDTLGGEELVQAMARAAWVFSYADWREEEDVRDAFPNAPRAGGGEDWFDLAPATPQEAREWALCATTAVQTRMAELARREGGSGAEAYICNLVKEVGEACTGRTFDDVSELVGMCVGDRHSPLAEQLGHYMFTEITGVGVCLDDDSSLEWPALWARAIRDTYDEVHAFDLGIDDLIRQHPEWR